MVHQFRSNVPGRSPNHLDHINAVARTKNVRCGVPLSNRARSVQRNQRLPFVPPENWYEPLETVRVIEFSSKHLVLATVTW